MKAVVVGAGLTGLSAAYTLQSRGIENLVLEKKREIGGLARSVRAGDWIFDLGPHRFHTKDQEILGQVRGLLGEDMLIRNRVSHIRLAGKWVAYPISPSAVFKFGIWNGLGAAYYMIAARLKGGNADNFEEWTTHKFGKRLYDLYFGPYTRKVWGISPSRISKDWASERIRNVGVFSMIKNMLFLSAESPRSFTSKYWYPRRGIGQLSEEYSRGSGKILTGTAVSEIREGEVLLESGKKIHFDRLISTIPITELVRLTNAPEPVMKAASRLTFRDMVFVFLKLKRKNERTDSWFYFPEAHFIFNRISLPSRFSPHAVPDAKGSFTAEITCEKGDTVWNLDDDELEGRVLDGIERAGLASGPEVEGIHVLRETHAYPVYLLDYKKNLEEIQRYLQELPWLQSTGRNGKFNYANMDECIKEGIDAANSI